MSRPLVLVTGATDGIGRQTAIDLARAGARVILHGRSAEKLEAARAEIGEAEVIRADLSSLAEVRRMAAEVVERFGAVDVLLNNAGVYVTERRTSADGHELSFAVNHLAPFLLTHLLLPKLRGRVVNVSSIAHARARLDLDDLDLARGFDGYGAYAASKLANVLFTVELARRWSGGTVNALHPGVVSTKLLKEGFGMAGPDSHADGAATSVFLALDPSVAGVTGRYFAKRALASPSSKARDAELCRRFYEKSCELVGIDALPA